MCCLSIGGAMRTTILYVDPKDIQMWHETADTAIRIKPTDEWLNKDHVAYHQLSTQ